MSEQPQPVEETETATPQEPNPNDPPNPDPEPSEPKPTETVDFWKQKAREQEARAKSNADAARQLKEIQDRDLSELEKAQRDAKDYQDRLVTFERTALRQQVALEKGLPATLVDRLQGETQEALASDADALMAMFKTAPRAPAPDPGQGPRESSPQQAADAEYGKFYPPNPNRK